MRKISVRSGHAFVSLACALAVSAFAVGCSSSGETSSDHETLARAAQPIIAGTTSTSDQDAVILLAIRSGGQLKDTCSGTLIAPNLVLTARHCVSDTDEGALCTKAGVALQQGVARLRSRPSDLYVYTGVNAVRPRTTRRARPRAARVHPPEGVDHLQRGHRVHRPRHLDAKDASPPFGSQRRARGRDAHRDRLGPHRGERSPDDAPAAHGIAVQAVGPLILDAQSHVGLGAPSSSSASRSVRATAAVRRCRRRARSSASCRVAAAARTQPEQPVIELRR